MIQIPKHLWHETLVESGISGPTLLESFNLLHELSREYKSALILNEDIGALALQAMAAKYIKKKLGVSDAPRTDAKGFLASIGLKNLKNVYFQRMIGLPFPAFIISFDSRNPGRGLTEPRVKSARLTRTFRAQTRGKGSPMNKIRLAPLQHLDDGFVVPAGALVLVRDLAGEGFEGRKFYR